jgi:hypothetical protein
MDRFLILQIDPILYKDKIIEFWNKYLPGTPHARIEWISKGNPAGPTLWFFAFERANNELAGMVSVIPREFRFKNQKLLGGMLGDFMVSNKYRVFGPAIFLQKYVIKKYPELGFHFIYTMTDFLLKGFAVGLGYKEFDRIVTLFKPLKTDNLLSKYMGKKIALLVSPLADVFFNFISYRLIFIKTPLLDEVTDINETSWNAFFSGFIDSPDMLSGNLDYSFMRWRYLQHFESRFRLLLIKGKRTNIVMAILFFTIEDTVARIYDLRIKEGFSGLIVWKGIMSFFYRQKCRKIYMVTGASFWKNKMRGLGFFNTHDEGSFLIYGLPDAESCRIKNIFFVEKII